MNRIALLPLLLASAALAQPATAQDVGVFSKSDAEDILADPAPAGEEPATTAGECPVPLHNGRCPRTGDTRGFSISSPRSGQTAAPRPSMSISRPKTNTGRAAETVGTRNRVTSAPPPKAATSRATANVGVGRSREVPLQFKLGSSELSPQSRANLTTLAGALNAAEHRGKKIRISGHTDRSGTLEANRRLSKQRAETAAAFLASKGVERGRIEAVGMAYEAPLAGYAVTNPRQRRVEVTRVE